MPRKPSTTKLDPNSDPTAIKAVERFTAVAKLAAKAKRSGGIVEWTDDPSGLRFDPIPNPKRYLKIGISPIAVKVDFGEPGSGVEKT
jgi:hypothetical protein